MNNEITNLSPKSLWAYFYELTKIPRPSKSEERVQKFIMDFGNSQGLYTVKDETGNILIRKSATPGMENRKAVVIQGHLDMVPQKNSETEHDFKHDPIKTCIDGGWVTAEGTTLGADNGIGVASMLAILGANDIGHGPVEALFTCDEETGMSGAFGLKPGWLEADILINTDSEGEGELYVGCAGGIDANIEFEYDELLSSPGCTPIRIVVSGLKGGHSGMDIGLGRGNAGKILFRFLKALADGYDIKLAEVSAGDMRNAIPREGYAVVMVPNENVEAVKQKVRDYESIVKSELSAVEPGLKFVAEYADMPKSVFDEMSQYYLINSVNACPDGVIRMSDDMPGMVETSVNMAIIKSANGVVNLQFLLRSSVESAKEYLAGRLESLFVLVGATVEFTGGYPGWKPNMESPILKVMQRVYNNMFGKVPEVKGVHAGLECGLLGAVYPNLDMISFGPTIRFAHSPDEKVNIESVEKYWDFLVETLKNIPER